MYEDSDHSTPPDFEPDFWRKIGIVLGNNRKMMVKQILYMRNKIPRKMCLLDKARYGPEFLPR